MGTVKLHTLTLLNFKGIRSLSVDFNETLTTISGCNGIGKTTIFDAFTWLLFGKDSDDRKTFNIKTLDEFGNPIPRIPHEVSAVLSVDGETITIQRRYCEKWQKKRGSSTEEFTGHEEERIYNDVPMSVKEWNEKISAICPEQIFKFVTNPLYFCSQKADAQRAMLFRMAGDVSNEEIANNNEDFKQLLANLTGKTMDELKREIASKKKRVKAEIDGIPERIDERKRDMPEQEDWNALNSELSVLSQQLSDADKAIADKSAAYTQANNARMAIVEELYNLEQSKITREYEIKQNVQKEYHEQCSAKECLIRSIESAQSKQQELRTNLTQLRLKAENLQQQRASLIAEWRDINSRTLVFNDDDFVCPTCKRTIDDIEERQNELTHNFNEKKASDLADNNARGKAVKATIEATAANIEECEKKIADYDTLIASQMQNPLYNITLAEPDATPMIDDDDVRRQLIEKINAIKAELDKPIEMSDTAELESAKNNIMSAMDVVKAKLAKKDIITRNIHRIAELESQLRTLSDELAHLEQTEYVIAQFNKARVEAIENRINSLFSIVQFKMFEQQINGGEVETCEAMVNGVPYSDLNNAAKINAGLDIINAICRSENITAPIFVDNAESVNALLPTEAQMIRLVVNESTTLSIQ